MTITKKSQLLVQSFISPSVLANSQRDGLMSSPNLQTMPFGRTIGGTFQQKVSQPHTCYLEMKLTMGQMIIF